MSLTTCIKRAGKNLNAEDKNAILEAARVNRKAGMSADDAAKAAVRARLEEVQALLAAEQGADVSTWTDGAAPAAPKTLKERAEAMAAKGQPVHQDPGEAPEVATKAVVSEAVKTAAENRDRKPSEMRAELLRMVDEAIPNAKDSTDQDVQVYEERSRARVDKKALDRRGLTGVMREKAEAEVLRRIQDDKNKAAERIGFVTLKVPGDGTFKLLNTVDRLKEFRSKVESSPGFKDRPQRLQAERVNGNAPVTSAITLANKQAGTEFGVERGSGGPKAVIENMVDDGDPQAAVDYAAARGLDVAEVLKGDKARLGKVAGLTPTAEAVGEFEPESAPEPAAPAQPAAASAATAEPWTLTREQAAKDYPGDEYDRMLNRHADIGDLSYTEADRRARINSLGQRKLWAKTRAQLEQEGKDAVKAARGDRAAINKLKSTPEFASWRLKSMSATGKQAIADAERLARDYLAIHKDRVQEALMEGKDVPAEVLADYPDLQRPASASPPAQQAEPATTDAQRKQAADHAKDLGGRVVWQRGELALIEGFSLLSGDSVYVAAKGDARTRVDIKSYTGSGYTEAERAELMQARADAVRAADEALARNPDGPFSAGPLVFAEDIPANVQGVVRGWISLLGLDGARIVVTTPKSGAAMADGLAGKFRRIGKASLSGDNTNGTMQPLGGDDFHIAVRPNVSTLKTLEVLAHELGHIVERRAFAQADPATQQAIRDAHAKWLKENGAGRALDMAQAMRAYRSGQTTGFSDDAKAAEAGAYWRSFGEWFADQVSRWTTTQDRPVGVVEQFFKRLADRLRAFFTGERAKFKPDTTMAQWLDSLAKDVPPTDEVAAQQAEPAPVSSREGQMNLANRGARIASLMAMNNRLRQIAPERAWADTNIENASNAELDRLQDQISAALVEAQRGPAPVNPLRAELEAMSGTELRDLMGRMGLAGKLMTASERVDALLAEDPAEVRAAMQQAEPSAPAPAEPDALTLTPKQYHDATLRAMADSTGATLAEVREMYDTEAGRANNEQEWVRRVVEAAQAGTTLTRATLDKLLELRPTTRLPETAIPEGYQRPEARKAEAEAAEAKREDRRTLKQRADSMRRKPEGEAAAETPAMPPIGSIPRDVAQRAHAGTSHVPEVRAGQEQESFRAALADAWTRAMRAAGSDEAAQARVREVFDDVQAGYRARYMRTLEARSRVMSSMITGPARFPVERNRKRMETERKRAEEASEYLSRGIKRMLRAARGPIDNSPESELESVRLRLAEREEAQETMKSANVALRKGDDAALEDMGFTAEQIAELKKGDFAGRKGFPDYKLTNNNAEIRRLRERLAEAQKRVEAAAAGPVEMERQGVRIVEDAQDDRLRLIFDGKPSDEVREDLKANGFKWSPKNEAWQRQLTDNAKYAAKKVLDKHFPADGPALPAMSRRMTLAQRAANFSAWGAGAAVIDREMAATRGFKTGERIVVEAYHGTARPDRVGTVFNPKRATSGPMAFFTSDPTLASSYAQGKEDTSIGQDYEGDYAEWFKVKLPGERSARNIDQAWWGLSPDERARIAALAPRVTSRENDDGNYDITLGPEGTKDGVGSYEYELSKTARNSFSGGNPLRALVESWLASGWLFNEEIDFLKVLRLAGFPMDKVEFASPREKYPFVYKTFIRMGNPLVTSDVPPATMKALEDMAARDRSRAQIGGADSWDKNTITPREWVAKLKDPERSTYAWTSIPDKVTEVLRAQGYDGIVDWSGKGGGDIVAPVYIPFAPEQIKSALGNKGTYDPEKKDILMSRFLSSQGFVSPRTLRDEVAKITANWDQDLADVEVVNRVEDLPADIQQAVRNVGSENTVRGLAMPDGRVFLVAENISTLDEGRFVLFHETYGHIGMRAFLGDGYDLQMRTLRQANPALAKEADAWFKLYGEDEIAARIKAGFAPLKARQMVNALAVEEALADRAGNAPELKGWKRLMAALQRGLRRLGLGSVADMLEGMTEAETLALLAAARETVQGRQRVMGVELEPAMSRRDDFMPRPEVATGTTEQGYPEYASSKVTLAFPQAAERFEVIPGDGQEVVSYAIMPPDSFDVLGHVELLVENGRPVSLLDIEVYRDKGRGAGVGRAVIETLLAANPGADLNISNIVPEARGFWERMGVPQQNVEGAYDGTLNWETYSANNRAAGRDTQGRGGARQGRTAEGAGSREGAAGQGQVGALFSRRTDQTQTPEFKRWFGDSKVVDAEGKPLVVYHGTRDDIAAFDGGRIKARFPNSEGFYFTSRPSHASAYADSINNAAEDFNPASKFIKPVAEGANVMPAYVSLQNPKIINVSEWGTLESSVDADGGARVRAARAAGHDGVIVKREADDEWSGVMVIAFRPEQIKSAIGNNGQFDPTNADIRFSRRTSQDILNAGGGVQDFSRYGKTKQDRLRSVLDKGREFYLGALTRDQIADVYGGDVPQVREYDKLVRSMENERSSLAQRADDLYQRWAKMDASTNDKLGRIMLDATTEQVHPDSDKAPRGKAEFHAKLRQEFNALPAEAQAMYREVREFHAGVLADIKASLIGRIERQVAAGAERAALLSKVQQQFDQYLENGPYFPLSRFGDYLVIATRPDGERVVAAYENSGEQQAAARELRKDGFTTKLKTAKEYARSQDGSAGKFIGDVIQAVEKVDMVEATINGSRSDLKNQLLDDLNQLFIRSLPDLSYRKHFAHRKNTPGFSADVMRGFASSAFHAASYIARLNHADRMTMGLQSAFEAIDNAAEGDFNTQSQVLNELTKRHEAMLNPNTHPLSALATQVGFVMHLGLSPAAGLINMLQVPMVTIPYLGARHGFAKASAAMGKAYADIMKAPANRQSGFNAAQSLALSPEERQAISTLQDEGVIDLTQAHDLAAATDRDVGDLAKNKSAFAVAKAMRIVGWTFHVPEVMNRQTTALMAYRLEREKGAGHEAALEAARETIKRTQFDYSSSNRARYMQGNIARVVLQFRQFSQNMTYFLGRAAYQALKGESPEVRKIARRQILSTFLVTGAMAGSMGLPGIGAAMGLVGMLVGAMDDADEPWDWQTEYRNMLADQFGKEWGEVFAKGVPRMLMPGWDIAGRVSLSDLWWRSNDREGQNPRESFASDMANILGPTAGTLLSWYVAADHMERGQYDKAVEAVVPKFIRDPLKAYREADEGVTSYNGDPLMDVEAVEVLGRALGFAPARVSEMYEGRNAVMNTKTALEEKRQRLLNAVVKARLDGDTEAEAEARSEVAGFNSRNPDFRITNMTIARSLMTRRRNRENTEQGILLPDTKADLRERARFANVE